MRHILSIAAAIAIGASAFTPVQAIAGPGVDIIIGAPPPVRYERVPSARNGYVWVNGYWSWNGHRHVWVGGHWERVRTGYNYRHPEWRQGSSGWYLDRGGWDREARHERQVERQIERRIERHEERREERRHERDDWRR